ncbi:4Fe-4S binding protein [Candidatus Bathyarchaeota archaeon]|nr:4Fe-4S binding protein [Candidatus Bathyarchaeota archaeon]
MQVRILDMPWEKINDQECTLCLECVGACPTGALSPKLS